MTSRSEVDLQQHEGLVRAVVRRFRWAERRGGIELDDLLQAGRIGLMRAAETHDPSKGAFSTHAVHWIRSYVGRFVADTARTVRVPVYFQQKATRAGRPLQRERSLDAPVVANDNGAPTWLEMLAYDGGPYSAPDSTVDRDRLLAAVDALPPRERKVLLQRFWGDHTLAEVGAELDLSRERVRQIEAQALVALRPALVGAGRAA